MGECADCWRHRQGTSYSVPVETVWPIIVRLKEELGSNEEICRRLGVAKNQISVVKNQERVRGTFVDRLKSLEYEIQQEKKNLWLNTMEPQVVEAEPFGWHLREFCRLWVIDRPLDQPGTMGPQDFMREHTGISLKQIGRYCNSQRPFVALSHADAILRAIGKQELIIEDEIKIIANPTWSLEAYLNYMKERGCV